MGLRTWHPTWATLLYLPAQVGEYSVNNKERGVCIRNEGAGVCIRRESVCWGGGGGWGFVAWRIEMMSVVCMVFVFAVL